MKTLNILHVHKPRASIASAMAKMKVFLPIAVYLLINFQFITTQDWLKVSKEQLKILRNNVSGSQGFYQQQADLVFLVDTSGSLWPGDFNEEKKFVMNLLNEMSIGMQATRVEVIPFGSQATKYITQISDPQVTKNKCTFNERFKMMDHSINGWMTNMRDAFQLAWEVCLNNALKRKPLSKVKTVVILLTDGYWNYPYDDSSPISRAQSLLAGSVEVFAIGVGYVDFPRLQQLVHNPDRHAFHLRNFNEFAELATYLRGGELAVLHFSKETRNKGNKGCITAPG